MTKEELLLQKVKETMAIVQMASDGAREENFLRDEKRFISDSLSMMDLCAKFFNTWSKEKK